MSIPTDVQRNSFSCHKIPRPPSPFHGPTRVSWPSFSGGCQMLRQAFDIIDKTHTHTHTHTHTYIYLVVVNLGFEGCARVKSLTASMH